MIADFIEVQHIRRKKKSSQLRNFISSSHASPGSGFVRQIQQNPASKKHRHKSRISIFRTDEPKWTDRPEKSVFSQPEASRAEKQRTQMQRKSPGFSFHVPSLMKMAVIAGIILVSLVALNWQGFSMPSSIVLNPAEDEAERRLASYAEGALAQVLPVDIAEQGEALHLDMEETFAWLPYKVKKGDSVSRIATNFSVSRDAIIASNSISNARLLPEGKMLRIPNMDGIPYTVQKGDNLSKISKSMGVPLEVILDVNAMRSETIAAGQSLFLPGARMSPEALRMSLGELFIFPVRKDISSNFGWRKDPFTGEPRYHKGVDLKANMGTPVKASLDGTVSLLMRNDREYGNYVIMKHPNGYSTLYAHLSAFSVKQGDRVAQGQKIGEVGSTGRSTGPHLHFSLYKNQRELNPLDYLR
jgi:murein DD-endopeptidase MepM/ murein hydrolase activator NlpD